MKSPYCLKKRKPQNVWYYKLQYEDTYHSTGEKTKAGADKYVISRPVAFFYRTVF